MRSVKRISSHGSVSIPVQMRRELNMQPRDAVDVSADQDGNIILKPHNPRCVFCGETESLALLFGKRICQECCRKAMELLQEGGAANG